MKSTKISYTLGEFKYELKNLKEVHGHDDSLPFVGVAYINGQKVAEVGNDGWGGDANIYVIADDQNTKDTFKKFCDVLKETTWTTIKCQDGTIIDSKWNIGFLTDCMAFNALVYGQKNFKSKEA